MMLHSNLELKNQSLQASLELFKKLIDEGILSPEAVPAILSYLEALKAIEEMHRHLNVENKIPLSHSGKKI